MATILKRNGARGVTWQAKVRKTGQRAVTKSFKRKVDAEVWAAEIERDFRLGRLVSREAERRTLADLIERYGREVPFTIAIRDSWVPCRASTQRIKLASSSRLRSVPERGSLEVEVTDIARESQRDSPPQIWPVVTPHLRGAAEAYAVNPRRP